MYNEITAWLMNLLPAGRYTEQQGQWVETLADPDTWYAVVQIDGGPAISVQNRSKDTRLFLFGPRNDRGSAPIVLDDIESFLQAALNGAPPCGAAHTRIMSEPSRPAYTTEGRAYTMLDLRFLF